MKLRKFIMLLPALMLMTSCTTTNDNTSNHPTIPTSAHKTKTKSKASKKAFDVLGSCVGENDLDLSKFAKGDIVIEDSKQVKGSKKHFDPDFVQEGVASWYGPRFHGRRTANGSVYNQHEYSAAHRTLPMPSVVRVINLENQRSVLVVINDRGPYVKKSQNRVIDLSRKAANDLGVVNKGTAKVRVEYLHDQTLALLGKFPESKKVVASAKLSQALIRHVTHLNVKNGARL